MQPLSQHLLLQPQQHQMYGQQLGSPWKSNQQKYILLRFILFIKFAGKDK